MKPFVPNRKTLFLDDEPSLLKALGRLASRFGIEPSIYSDPHEALRHLSNEKFGIIVSDYRMPQMTGTEFLAESKKQSPNSVRILLTGYADIDAAIQAVNKSNVYKYLTKPWDDELFRQTLEEALRQFNLTEHNAALQSQVTQAALQLKKINANLEQLVEKRTAEIRLLNGKLESGFLGSIKLMGSVAHRGDPRSAAHAKRVAAMSVEIGKELDWSKRDLLELQIAAYLHDIADSTNAANPGHAEEGTRLMRMIPNLGNAYDYVLYHHERMNGQGNHRGLRGEDIPLGARILAVADSFDEAMHLTGGAESATPNKVLYALKSRCPHELDERIVAALQSRLKKLGQLNDEDYETTVNLIGLMPGMVLSRDLLTKSGTTLLPKDNKLTRDYIAKIFKRHAEDPVVDDIFVYRNSVPKIPERRAG